MGREARITHTESNAPVIEAHCSLLSCVCVCMCVHPTPPLLDEIGPERKRPLELPGDIQLQVGSL